MSNKSRQLKSSGFRGKTKEQVAALKELRVLLFREFAAGKDRKDLKELSKKYRRSETTLRDYHKLYVAGEFEEYRPADLLGVPLPETELKKSETPAPKEEIRCPEVAPTVRWIASDFIPLPTKARLMAGR